MLNDRELAERFPGGDDDVVTAVYARYGGAVFTVARSIVGAGAAADVVQATFLNAWRASARFDSRRELAPWLYTIARRQALDHLRREGRLTVTDPSDLDGPDESSMPSLEREWENFQVRAAIDGLPADERELVKLAWFDELSHPEIAERLGIPVGTVKSRSYRAQHRLAAVLSDLRTNRPDFDGVQVDELGTTAPTDNQAGRR